MKFFLITAALAIPALALPEPMPEAVSLEGRDNVKLNHNHDRNILFHAAPVSGRCYALDDKTGAFFYNTGGFWQSYSYDGGACTGTAHQLQRYTGRCVERGSQNSVKFA
ncbi:hypothetical protein PFICI_14208 [Pestalotiopsis fici W106-1]|uniref:Uncharacterized protein n=1 Tax=Pestalotiopsis fici (strain W106-1 / CGMCC3.15140) TaxID=1229662 RepID=W3WMH1_PESFW|nr:uncharacterized protein PFICI_14208 [Pestalotiopsis fici W106-1]ETS74342.1 hypothetical protein PFICI_14208 [Pestalotiopsis fici W106-1]